MNIPFQDFGNIKDLTPIRSSNSLFSNKENRIIYKLPIKTPEEKQNIEKEIKAQNELAKTNNRYLGIVQYAFGEGEYVNIVYMVISIIISEIENSSFVSFSEMKDRIIKVIQFQNIIKHMRDLELNNKKVFYLRLQNIFYYRNQLYFMIFGCIQELKIANPNNVQTLIKNLEELTNQSCSIDYIDENNEYKTKQQISKYKIDLALLIYKNILNINSDQIQIQEINKKCDQNSELKNIANIIIDLIVKDSSIEQISLNLQQINEGSQIQQKFIEEWEMFLMNLKFKQEQKEKEEMFKQGIDLKCLRELEQDQFDQYQKVLENYYRQDDSQNKQKGQLLIKQAEYRKEAIKLIKKQSKDPHLNLIYFLNEKELMELKQDKSLLRQFNNLSQNDEAKINKYIELQQKITLNEQVFQRDQLKLIPIKILQANNNLQIKEYCTEKKLQMMKKTYGVECFEFEIALEAKNNYDKFLLAIKNNKQNENPLDYKLTFEQITSLDENRQKNYRDIIQNKIDSLKNQNNQDQFLNYINAFNESFKKLEHEQQKALPNFSGQLYQDEQEGLKISFNVDFLRSQNYAAKLQDFFRRKFNGEILIDLNLKSYLRKFGESTNSNYNGNLFKDKKHGLGLKKINENHLKFGIFSFDQLKWGWEIILQKNNIISFSKGNFLNEQKYGQFIQQKYDYRLIDPILIEEYVGMFQKDKREGLGVLKNLESQTKIEGNFKEDKLNGYAKEFKNYNILIFEGFFVNDLKDGFGKEYKENKEFTIYGDYYNDQISGTHIKTYQDGRIEEIQKPTLRQSSLCSVF